MHELHRLNCPPPTNNGLCCAIINLQRRKTPRVEQRWTIKRKLAVFTSYFIRVPFDKTNKTRFDRSRRERKDRLCQLVLKLAPRSSHPNAARSLSQDSFIKIHGKKNKRKRREEDNKILSIISRSLEKYQAWKIEKRKRSFRYHLLLPREDEN